MIVSTGNGGTSKYRVFLDGHEVTEQCFLADSDNGCVYVYRRNDVGQFYVDPTDRNLVATERLCGSVLIKCEGSVG